MKQFKQTLSQQLSPEHQQKAVECLTHLTEASKCVDALKEASSLKGLLCELQFSVKDAIMELIVSTAEKNARGDDVGKTIGHYVKKE